MRRLLLVLATVAGVMCRAKTLEWLGFTVGIALICGGIAAIYAPAAAIVAGVALIVTVGVLT